MKRELFVVFMILLLPFVSAQQVAQPVLKENSEVFVEEVVVDEPIIPFVPFKKVEMSEEVEEEVEEIIEDEPEDVIEEYTQSLFLGMIEATGTYQDEPASLLIIRKLQALQNSESETAKGFLKVASIIYALENIFVTDNEISALVNGNKFSLEREEETIKG